MRPRIAPGAWGSASWLYCQYELLLLCLFARYRRRAPRLIFVKLVGIAPLPGRR